MCYTYNSGIVSYDAVDPMELQRIDQSGRGPPVPVDDGVSNSWDVLPPRLSAPFFQDTSFQTWPTPPKTATYRVLAFNQWRTRTSMSTPFTVKIDLTTQPVPASSGTPPCGPLSKPYRRCMPLQFTGPHVTGAAAPIGQ